MSDSEIEMVPLSSTAAPSLKGRKQMGAAIEQLRDNKKLNSFLSKPYNWALMMVILIAIFKAMGVAIPLWILYLCAIPFCFTVIFHQYQSFKNLLNTGENAFASASPAIFLLIQLVILITIYKSKDDIIANHSKIPDNFPKFQLTFSKIGKF